MQFTFAHNNLNMLNLEKSLAFYKEALGLVEVRRHENDALPWSIWGMAAPRTSLELTWLKDRKRTLQSGGE